MTSTQPLDWIRQIDTQLAELDEKPQFGVVASLNWQQLETDLCALFNRSDLKLLHVVKGWVAAGQCLEGLGDASIRTLNIDLSPLGSSAFFVTSEFSFKELMGELLAPEQQTPFFYDTDLVDGFCTYFATELLRLLSKQKFVSSLAPQLGSQVQDVQKKLQDESCFAIEVSLQIGDKTLWGRVLLSESFRREWKTYFGYQEPAQLTDEMRNKLYVEIGLRVGQSGLKFEEWKNVKQGDFVILDTCSYDPVRGKGAVILTLDQKPLLRGRLKEGGIKITNYPVFEEVNEMEEEFKHPQEPGEEENLYGDLAQEDESQFDEDEEFFADLEETPQQSKKEYPNTTLPAEPLSLKPEELPVQLTVEVGRIKMTAAALMNLAPGNLLELSVTPEQGVNLVVNGKKVGRGELIRMGDILGVRILSL
jgi:flagellar motor switch protein FliN